MEPGNRSRGVYAERDVAMANGTKKCILLGEGHPANMELAVDWLELAGYQVLPVPTAEEVILLAHQNRPDLILMDTRLPGMDGLEAIRKLKQDPVLSLSPSSWCPPR
jgi:CheY-like chemotaxis protein